MSWTHVHLGAGRFGLGMVVDVCAQAGLNTVVLNRNSSKEHLPVLQQQQSYKVVYLDSPSAPRTIPVRVHYYDNESDSAACECIADPAAWLLTASVTPEGLADIAPLIARGIEGRRSKDAGPLYVMACENQARNSEVLGREIARHLGPETESYFRERVVFCNTVVDRVCDSIDCSSGEVAISAERFADWIIYVPGGNLGPIRQLEEKGLVTVAGSQAVLEAFAQRKYWLLNGVHLAAAAYAYDSKEQPDRLAAALEDDDIRGRVEALQEELGLAFRCYAQRTGVLQAFPEHEIQKYNEEVLDRFQGNPKDRVARLLKHSDGFEPNVKKFVDDVWVDMRERGLNTAVRKNLGQLVRVLDLHEFLSRVAERIVAPQKELLEFRSANRQTLPGGGVTERLVLDAALQTIVLSMQKYANRCYLEARESMRSEH